jgi:hypothetical protein
MLNQILEEIGLRPTKGNKEVVKAMLKKAHGIDTLAGLSDAGWVYFIEQSAILLAGEFAIAIAFPGEERSTELDLKNFYKTIYGTAGKTKPDSTGEKEHDAQVVD